MSICFYEHYLTALRGLMHFATNEGGLGNLDEARLFSQRLLNRLLLVRFIEARGWLDFEGRSDYLRALFEAGGVDGGSIYQTRIKSLFGHLAGTSRQPTSQIGIVPVPGPGPFDESDLDRRVADLPDEQLAPVIGDFGLLYEFEFTIDESTAAGGTAAVDPEMLGTVFEELVTGRHETGAYYTPRDVVAFMCREALKGILAARTDVPAANIACLIDEQKPANLTAAAAIEIRAGLDELRVIDPACGSGAYLIGMLGELIAIHRALDRGFPGADLTPSRERKLRIIRNHLFGIDLDPLATEIARLRLWLALAVDAAEPVPIPVLDSQFVTGDTLLDNLPAEFRDGSFDIVLANPPYVRHELIDGSTKRALRRRYAAIGHGKADLYCYFFARGLELLRDGGMHVFICSNSWLDVGFGARLQEHLLSQGEIVAIYDSQIERQFSTADVNTVVSVIRKQVSSGNPMTRFVSLRAPLAEALREPGARREVAVTRDELWQPRGSTSSSANCAYRGGKWSGKYLRAPDSFSKLLEAPIPLVRLGDLPFCTIGRGRRTGCDEFFCLAHEPLDDLSIEPRFLKPLVKSPTEFRWRPPCTSSLESSKQVFVCHEDRSALEGTAALRYIEWGERVGLHRRSVTPTAGRWYDLGRQPTADLILPIAFSERFFVVENDARAEVHQRFATLHFGQEARHFLPAVSALLSSSLVPLMAEVLGRHNLGQGALDFPPDDWREVLLPDMAALPPQTIADLAGCWKEISAKVPVRFSAAVRDPTFRRLDAVVARALGCDESLMEKIRRDALSLIESRLAKARRVQNRKTRAS